MPISFAKMDGHARFVAAKIFISIRTSEFVIFLRRPIARHNHRFHHGIQVQVMKMVAGMLTTTNLHCLAQKVATVSFLIATIVTLSSPAPTTSNLSCTAPHPFISIMSVRYATGHEVPSVGPAKIHQFQVKVMAVSPPAAASVHPSHQVAAVVVVAAAAVQISHSEIITEEEVHCIQLCRAQQLSQVNRASLGQCCHQDIQQIVPVQLLSL